MNGFETVIGFAAAIGTTIAFVPQVIKSWRTRSVDDLSLLMVVMFFSGVVLWVVYGVLRDDIVVVVANLVSTVLVGSLLALKLGVGRRRD